MTVKPAIILLAVALLASAARPSFGQAPARYPTPALSPWFDLYQRQSGPVDNYNMFVRPEMQLRNTLRNQQSNLQLQGSAISSQTQQITQMEEDRRAIAPTGTPTGFMNYGRYFGVANTVGQAATMGATPRPNAKAGRGTWTLPPANSRGGK